MSKSEPDWLLWIVTISAEAARGIFVEPWVTAACWNLLVVPFGAPPLTWGIVLGLTVVFGRTSALRMMHHIEDDHGDKQGVVSERKAFGREVVHYRGLLLMFGLAHLFIYIGWPGELQ